MPDCVGHRRLLRGALARLPLLGVPDVAFTAEMDGQDSMSLNESNPFFQKFLPAGAVEGSNKFIQPRPGNK